ncbi:MAG: PEP-CTERM sorting domain-containing protein [Verrucomicrobia bacterium]|nr:MAG: PEP-CTERM sorting domain-containing protein [Verrucomicrobiota bacterium]
MKSKALCFLAAAGLSANAYSAVYSTSFTSLLNGDNVADQDGWVINDAGMSTITPVTISGVTGNFGGIGYAEAPSYLPTQATVDLSHPYGEQIVNASDGGSVTSFTFMMRSNIDGTAGPLQDTFGISLTSAAGNVFSVAFAPGTSTAAESFGDPLWKITYTVGNGPSTSYLEGGISPDAPTTLILGFTRSHSGIGSHFNLQISGATAVGGDTSLATGTLIDNFHLLWTPDVNPANAGPNALLVTDISIIPETSTSLLLCLAGVGLATRRRRA